MLKKFDWKGGVDKIEFIKTRCKDKKVLDLGCVEHNLYDSHLKDSLWLHSHIKETAKELIGIDNDKKNVRILNKRGFNIINGDVERLEKVKEIKGEKFDVIVVGDLIEHLFNQGMLLDGLKKLCNSNTEIIITTPNCFSSKYVYWYYILGKEKEVNKEHTCWYSALTLKQLLGFKGFSIEELHYRSDVRIDRNFRTFKFVLIRKLFPRLCEGLIVVSKCKGI
jgi:2-polyprenyl-3-methyl-5-hydroxy-6-metoxy-1,4-benzoquinol methylase